MNVAVYSQSGRRREYLQQHIALALRAHGLREAISVYGEGSPLCDAIASGRHEIVVIDLERTGNAFAVANQLRQRNMECGIIFVADGMDHLLNVMKYRTVGYLLYPLEQEELNRVLGTAVCYDSMRMHQYVVHTRLHDHLVLHSQIRYFRSAGHYVYVYAEGSEDPLVHLRRLDDIQKEVAALPYIRCHQSYLVNLRYIDHVSGRFIVLKDGEQLPVSRRYAEQLVALLEAMPKRSHPEICEACGIQ